MNQIMRLSFKQVPKLRKYFAKDSSTKIKLSKTQLCKILHSRGGLGELLKNRFRLMKYVLKLLAKNVLIPLGSTAAAAAVDAGIH